MPRKNARPAARKNRERLKAKMESKAAKPRRVGTTLHAQKASIGVGMALIGAIATRPRKGQ